MKHSLWWWAASLAAVGICIAVICGAVPFDKAKDVLLFMAICIAIEEGRTLRRIIEKRDGGR